MTPLQKLYYEELQHFHKLQESLNTELNTVATLKPSNMFGFKFVPIGSSILEQLSLWPKDMPILPLTTWVEPQKGTIEFHEEQWDFFLSGQGVSFRNSQTSQKVGIEFSAKGDIGITKWIVGIFLKKSLSSNPDFEELLSQHENLFDELVELNYLTKIEPRAMFDEDVFSLNTG